MNIVLLIGLIITLAVVIAARRQRRARITTIETHRVDPKSAEDSDA